MEMFGNIKIKMSIFFELAIQILELFFYANLANGKMNVCAKLFLAAF